MAEFGVGFFAQRTRLCKPCNVSLHPWPLKTRPCARPDCNVYVSFLAFGVRQAISSEFVVSAGKSRLLGAGLISQRIETCKTVLFFSQAVKKLAKVTHIDSSPQFCEEFLAYDVYGPYCKRD
eukprot:scaffold326077_cov20-Prasinocladus_malaysianus.AAC.1